MRREAVLTCAFLASLVSRATGDEFCSHLFAFEQEHLSIEKTAPARHWVELHWLGNWLDLDHGWHLQCTNSNDAGAQAFCLYLTAHTSFEFPDRLPRAVLKCHGYVFPDVTYWEDWKAEIDLQGHSDNSVLLEIDQTGHVKPDKAIRLSAFRPGDDDTTQPLPPLIDGRPASAR